MTGPPGTSAGWTRSESAEILRHGAYVCLRAPNGSRSLVAGAGVPALANRLGFRNEFATDGGHPADAIAFLRRVDATPGPIPDEGILEAEIVIHVASAAESPVALFCDELARLLRPPITLRVLAGVVRPTNFTGHRMEEFAYAHQVAQRRGDAMPHAFLHPMSKTPEWWAKGWMERHTYFLPRYDDEGRMVSEGHALAAEKGIACLLRRTYKSRVTPAPEGSYDFVNYFECADADVPVFHEVCARLRDVARNPEWRFVREGPTWHGRRVATWADLFT